MATIAVTVTETGQTTLTRTLTLADADLDATIQAYQQAANTSINGTATRAQVLNYMFNVCIVAAMQQQVQTFKTVPAVTPPPISIV